MFCHLLKEQSDFPQERLEQLRLSAQERQAQEMADQTVGKMVVAGQVTMRDVVRTLDTMGIFERYSRMAVEGGQQ